MDFAVWPRLGHNPTLETLFTCVPWTETKVGWSVPKGLNAVYLLLLRWVIGRQEKRVSTTEGDSHHYPHFTDK